MNGLELCVWLNGCEGLSANVLQHVDLSDGPEKIVEKLRRDGIVSQRCADRLEKLARENWHGKEASFVTPRIRRHHQRCG